MNAKEMSDEIAIISGLVKARWPSGFASIINNGGGRWSCVIHDDDLKCSQFHAATPEGAFGKARDFLKQQQPMTKERLAAILGIEVAA